MSEASRLLIFFVFVSLLSQSVFATTKPSQPPQLTIASHELQPYHWLNKQGEMVGPAYSSVRCILSKLGQKYDITVFPWTRAQELVRHGKIDAFFIASRNKKRLAGRKISIDSW